ncbi:unnamed protein product, partial [Musa hybrid cultivar]
MLESLDMDGRVQDRASCMEIRSRRTRNDWAGHRSQLHGSPCRRRGSTPPWWLQRGACTGLSCRGSSNSRGRRSRPWPAPPSPRPPPPRSTEPSLPCREPCPPLPCCLCLRNAQVQH